MLTKAQQDALKWLDEVIGSPVQFNGERQHARTIREMLAEPRLPKEPTPEILGAMMDGWHGADPLANGYEAEYRALRAHLTKPATKTVEVWRVEYADRDGDPFIGGSYASKLDAERLVDELEANGYSCIHVTGPHKQEVPA